MAKILITGASGRLGNQLIRRLDEVISGDNEVYLLQNRNPINLDSISRNFQIVCDLSKETYDCAVHFAGNIHTSRGNPTKNPENYPEFVRDNIDMTREVCQRADHVIYASTDNVFSG